MSDPIPHPGPAILFDLDGTLIDTLPDLVAASNAFLAEHDAAPLPQERVQAMIGDGLLALAAKVMAAGGIRPQEPIAVALQALRFRQIYEGLGHGLSTVYPHVRETLATLKADGYRLALCTNKTEAMAQEMLVRFDLADLFATVGGSDSFRARKPDPAHVRGVLDRLGVSAGRAVMVGDSANDVRAAQGAQVRSVIVAYGYGLQGALAAGPEMVVARFADLPPVLARMLAPAPSVT
ncbi:MAG: HAD-IA family hydrolase [Alphaproteobacteria bacterium]